MLDLQQLKANKAPYEEILNALKSELSIEQLEDLATQFGIRFRTKTSNKKKFEESANFLSTLFMYQRIAGE